MPKPVDWKIHNLGDLLKQNPNALTVQVQPPETDPVVLERERLETIIQEPAAGPPGSQGGPGAIRSRPSLSNHE